VGYFIILKNFVLKSSTHRLIIRQPAYPSMAATLGHDTKRSMGITLGPGEGGPSVLSNDERIEIGPSNSLFVCHLTGRLMKEPHSLSDGHSYERLAILRWTAKGHRTSPATNIRLGILSLLSSLLLCVIVDEYVRLLGLMNVYFANVYCER
jgi:hypothetical protein